MLAIRTGKLDCLLNMLNLVDFNSARDEQGTKVYFIRNQQLVDNSSAFSDNMIVETDDFHLD